MTSIYICLQAIRLQVPLTNQVKRGPMSTTSGDEVPLSKIVRSLIIQSPTQSKVSNKPSRWLMAIDLYFELTSLKIHK